LIDAQYVPYYGHFPFESIEQSGGSVGMGASLNPPADYLFGTPGYGSYMTALAHCRSSAFFQCCTSHPLHEAYALNATRSRKRAKIASRRETLSKRAA
jgi:hypothetical protein